MFLGLSAGIALFIGYGLFERPRAQSFFDLLSGDVRWILDWKLFQLGNTPVTTLFLVKCTLYLVALTIAARMSRRFFDKRILAHTSIDRGQKYAMVRAFGYLIFLLGLIIGLESTGLDLRSLMVVGGALGVGVGFGLQSIVANFVAGIVILWERPIKVGDLIDVGNTNGEVIRIGARGSWVRTFDNEVIIVPNSEFVNSRVTNWTANDRTVRLSVPVGVSYDCDLEKVSALLVDIARQNSEVLVSPAPVAIITGFGDNAVNVVLRVSIAMAEHTGKLKSDLFLEILRVFREQKIEMPFPQQDIHVRSVDMPLVVSGIDPRPGRALATGESAA
jgi:small-conductance mechanosensitive channel